MLGSVLQAVKDKKTSDMLLVVMSTLSTAAYLLPWWNCKVIYLNKSICLLNKGVTKCFLSELWLSNISPIHCVKPSVEKLITRGGKYICIFLYNMKNNNTFNDTIWLWGKLHVNVQSLGKSIRSLLGIESQQIDVIIFV